MIVTFRSLLSPWKILSASACAASAAKRSSAVAASNALLKAVVVMLARPYLKYNSNQEFQQL
jgi:hypothetical protein